MGAYYQAVIDKEKRYSTWESTNDGAKLMEHSYMFNDYVNGVLNMTDGKSFKLDWLCDYHEAEDAEDYTWSTTKECKKFHGKEYLGFAPGYILNHTKECYIDNIQLISLYYTHNPSSYNGFYIHPLPILCNSDREAQGGGDFNKEDIRRGTWRNDDLQILWDNSDISSDYKNITSDCMFYED